MAYEGSKTTRAKIVEVDAGYDNNINDPITVIVIDSDIAPDSIILATQSAVPPSSKDEDEAELDHFIVKASPSSNGGSMNLLLYPMQGITLTGKYMVTYMIG